MTWLMTSEIVTKIPVDDVKKIFNFRGRNFSKCQVFWGDLIISHNFRLAFTEVRLKTCIIKFINHSQIW